MRRPGDRAGRVEREAVGGSILVPALAAAFGEWSWWPSRRSAAATPAAAGGPAGRAVVRRRRRLMAAPPARRRSPVRPSAPSVWPRWECHSHFRTYGEDKSRSDPWSEPPVRSQRPRSARVVLGSCVDSGRHDSPVARPRADGAWRRVATGRSPSFCPRKAPECEWGSRGQRPVVAIDAGLRRWPRPDDPVVARGASRALRDRGAGLQSDEGGMSVSAADGCRAHGPEPGVERSTAAHPGPTGAVAARVVQ